MTGKHSQKQARLFLTSAAILLLGLCSAVAIYFAADKELDEAQGYEVVGGKICPGMQERSKKYLHDLELYGGKRQYRRTTSIDGSTVYGGVGRLRSP